jgi:hypothetical protein
MNVPPYLPVTAKGRYVPRYLGALVSVTDQSGLVIRVIPR